VGGGDEALRVRLERFLRAELDDAALVVSGLTRLGGGSSRENWAFELGGRDGAGGDRPMLLRRDPVASVAETDREAEVALLRALATAPFPTPVVVAADLAGARLERPSVILARAPGRADRAALREKDPLRLGEPGRTRLALDLCDLLADVHTLTPDEWGLPAAVGGAAADPAAREIERWEREVGRAAVEPQPELAYVATWLSEHRPPPPERVTLVHADFRPANVLVEGGAVSVLLDWEFAHLGDPAEDVGWYCAPIYRREHFLAGAWSQPDFLTRYEARSGLTLEPERLHFWQVLAMFKLGAIMLAGIKSFVEGETDRAAGPTDDMLRAVVASTRGPGR
jgi:aminoglycoside phosphotransferase (APT) family kinase protein